MSAVGTAITAHSVLSSGSGTHFAILVFLPLLLAPGIIVWLQPRPRAFAIWTALASISSIIWSAAGSPEAFERQLAGWRAVQVSAWTTIGIVVVGSAVAAFWFSARQVSEEDLATPLARRLRRIVQLVVPTAIVSAVAGLLPGYQMYFDGTYLHTETAGGGWLILFLALALAPAAVVYRDPRRRWAWLWAGWTFPSLTLSVMVSFGFRIFERSVPLWPAQVVRFGVCMIFVLVMLAVPLIALVSRGADEAAPSPLPRARLR